MDNKISSTEWKEGLMIVCNPLRTELINFLTDEGRYYGKVKSFINNIRDALADIVNNTTPEELDKYERVLGIIKGTLYKEFRRLGRRRLSPADRTIVLFNKLLDLIDEIPSDDFRYERGIRTMKKVITKLYDNIRNPGKKDSLFALTELIQSSVSSEKWYKFRINTLDLYHVEHPKPKVKTLDGPMMLMDSKGTPEVIKEITL